MALRAGQEEILTLCPNVSRLMVRDGRQVIDSEGSGFSPFDSPYNAHPVKKARGFHLPLGPFL